MPISHPSRVEYLRQLEPFRTCTPKKLRRVERLLCPMEVPAGTVLCTQGQVGREAFIIVSGRATVAIEGVQVAKVGPGSIVGEMSVLDACRRTASVTAETAMVVLVVTPQELTSLLLEVPELTRALLATTSGRLRLANRWVTQGSSAGTP